MEDIKKTLFLICDKECAFSEESYKNEHDFTLVVRTKYIEEVHENYGNFCDKWIKAFSTQTKTQWIVRSTWPNLKKLLYRKKFVCHHNNFNKRQETQRKRCNSMRNKEKQCTAEIDFKIKKINRGTIKNDPFLKKGYAVVIKIVFKHSHNIHVAEAYSFLKMSEDTKEAFLKYFEEGLTPASAKNLHEMNLLILHDTYDDVKTVNELLADSQVNPKETEINNLYKKWRQNTYGNRQHDKSVFEILEHKIRLLNEKGFIIRMRNDPLILVIITPIMKRAHEQNFAAEICFMDSSGSCDQSMSSLTLILAASKVGGIPLACILHTSQTEENYTAALSVLKEAIPDGFGGKGAPEIFMTDDSKAERNALKNIFPNSNLLLCSFHICQSVWRWLWNQKNCIPKDDRKILMLQFRSILYAVSTEECEDLYNDLLHKNTKYLNFVNYLQNLWERKKEWCLSYRKNLCTRGHNTNNIVEASIRVMKDIILQRCKAFNMVALTDFIVNVLENYHMRRLLAYANSRRSYNDILYEKIFKRSQDLSIKKVDDVTYLVNSVNDSELFYTVKTNYAICDCYEGIGGKYCKHLCAVQNHLGLELYTCPKLSSSDKKNLAYIATGEQLNQFYTDMDMVQNENDIANDNTAHSNNLQIQPTKNTCENPNFTSFKHRLDENENDNKAMDAVNKMETELERIVEIAKLSKNTILINKFTKSLQKIKTTGQLEHFFISKIKENRKGKIISVQPTSCIRRKARSNFKCGRKRIQSGRPSKNEEKKTKKKSHKLIKNINENVSHAKQH